MTVFSKPAIFQQERMKHAEKQTKIFPPPFKLKDFPLKEKSKNAQTVSIKLPVNPAVTEANWTTANTYEYKATLYQGGENPTNYIHFRLELDHLIDTRGANEDIAVKKNLCNMLLGGEQAELLRNMKKSLLKQMMQMS
jgi:hypothetical protein